MSLNLGKSTWTRVAFGDVVRNVNNTTKEPSAFGVERVIAMEHMDPGELQINRWGDIAEGTTFTRLVTPGQTLFGKRRAYQRKVAFAEFEAVCSGDIYTFEAVKDALLPELLPFIVQSEGFFEHALGTSAGSLSPRTNWRDLANFEFTIPPLEEQQRIADLLWAVERHREAIADQTMRYQEAIDAWSIETLDAINRSATLSTVIRPDRPLCYGVVQPGPEVEEGVGLIRVLDLGGDGPESTSLKQISNDVDAQCKRSRVEKGDVLVSIVGTIGRTWIVTEEFSGCNIARALARISVNDSLMRPEFLHWVISSPHMQRMLERAAFESARKTLNLAVLATLEVPVPSIADQDSLLLSLERARRASVALREEDRALLSLRSSLLNELFGDN